LRMIYAIARLNVLGTVTLKSENRKENFGYALKYSYKV